MSIASSPLDFELRLGSTGENHRIQCWAWAGRDVARVPSIDDAAWSANFQSDSWEGVLAGRFAVSLGMRGTPGVADALPELCAIVLRFSDAVDEVMYFHPGIAVTMDASAMSAATFAGDLDVTRAFCDRARRIDFAARDA